MRARSCRGRARSRTTSWSSPRRGTGMPRLLRSEVYRLVRRWMPWVLLGIMVLLAFVAYELIWVSSNAQLALLRSGNVPTTPNAPPPDVQIRQLEQAIQTLQPSRLTDLGV